MTAHLPFVYIGRDAQNGEELWVSDGSQAGTKLLKDIWPGAHGSDIGNMTRLPDGRVLFTAADPVHGNELWVTDGTESGTEMLYDVNDGSGSFGPVYVTPLSDGRVVFEGQNSASGREIWVTDGTRDGTHVLMEITPGAEGTDFNAPWVALPDGKFQFSYWTPGADGRAISRTMISDGTPGGTVDLSGFLPAGSSRPVVLGEQLLFFSPEGMTLTDGTAEGTHQFDQFWGRDNLALLGSIGEGMALVKATVFDAYQGSGNYTDAISYYATNGAETHLIATTDIARTTGNPLDLGAGKFLLPTTVDGEFRLIVTDGSEAGTKIVATGSEAWTTNYISLGDGRAIYSKADAGGHPTLWLVDGDGQTALLGEGDAVPTSLSTQYVQHLSDGTTVFAAQTAEGSAVLWQTDGTAEGTHQLPVSNPWLPPVLRDFEVMEVGAIPTTPPPEDPSGPGTPSDPALPHHEWATDNALFDAAFYLDHNPDVAAVGADPLQHFLQFGAAEGRDPNSHFDVSFYLNQNPDILAAGVNALEHYMTSGWHEGRAASFSFDGDAYLAANDDVAKAGMNPLEHYLHFGEAEHRDAPQATPHATGPQNVLVDASFYFSNYADVAREGVDPTQHFMVSGWQEGRDPNAFFDTNWYLAHNTDVATAQVNPLEHYLRFGAEEGRDPSAVFDGEAYLAHNPDVAAAGMNPLEHYLQYGAAEGRDIFAA
ncbi:hypothetical protein E0493_22700 [Roseomonas sp. M0104]|uniref:Uncharacterized protein n=1 Tax=Teichococcus coralli TaxID=2545983 RepID=A0A845BF05_9PROT|nr:hypothetical protein [Pseudoroseomonas coralli]MXP66143.1 hypothetical protein [Pseudoroseomonas coralli]